MEPESSLNRSIDSATKHYSSLFFLPSYRTSLSAVAVICIVAVTLCTFAFFPSLGSLVLGLSLFALTLLADTLTSRLILKGDPIFSPRRILAMSYFGWLLWLAFIALGVGAGYFLGQLLWVKLCLVGLGAVLTLRSLVFSAVSYSATWKQAVSMLLQPLLCVFAFVVFWVNFYGNILPQLLLYIVVAPVIAFAAVFLFLNAIDRLGRKAYQLPALPLFKAFLLNWVTGENAPLEKHLEEMGEDSDIAISLIKFDASKPKAAVIVPQVHPGPFKNIGSSLLPSMLKHDYEEKYGCDACTPLGILGHELDLASQEQNRKVVTQTLEKAKFATANALATPFVTVSEGTATASCQIFGDTAFLSFTLAPKTTEDLPQELGREVTKEAESYGLKHAVVVNAHNSLSDIVDTEQYVGALKMAASKCLKKAISLPTKPFLVGAATVFPEEFTQKQGMGTGGITAITVEVDSQKTAYIVIDGNNMIPGLREKVIAALKALGFDESEVFTTDSHAVSALVTGRRGYHPIGEVMDHTALIRVISNVAKQAAATLEVSRVGCLQFVVPKVRVIGEDRLKSVTMLVDVAIEKAKRIIFPIFGAEGLLLILLLLLF